MPFQNIYCKATRNIFYNYKITDVFCKENNDEEILRQNYNSNAAELKENLCTFTDSVRLYIIVQLNLH
jgi:hypothetical protein